MSINSSGFVEEGFSKANVEVLSVLVLCLHNSRRFYLISNESARRACGNGSLATKMLCGKGSGVEKVLVFCLVLVREC
jgi:hypothetical protein